MTELLQAHAAALMPSAATAPAQTSQAPATGSAALTLDGVGVDFGDRTVIAPLDFEVRPGEFLCLVGP